MPIGEVIGEVILRPILEVVFYGASYSLGYVALKVITLGTLKMAPLKTVFRNHRSGRKWGEIDWSIWHSSKKQRVLKADAVCLTGFLVATIIGAGIYFSTTAS